MHNGYLLIHVPAHHYKKRESSGQTQLLDPIFMEASRKIINFRPLCIRSYFAGLTSVDFLPQKKWKQ